jgi:hypothetical protein
MCNPDPGMRYQPGMPTWQAISDLGVNRTSARALRSCPGPWRRAGYRSKYRFHNST